MPSKCRRIIARALRLDTDLNRQSLAPGCALDAHGVAPASEACSIGSLVAVFFPVGTLRPMIARPPSLLDANSCAKWFSL